MMTHKAQKTATKRRRFSSIGTALTLALCRSCLLAATLVLVVGCSAERTRPPDVSQNPNAVSSLMSAGDCHRLDALTAQRAAEPVDEGSSDGYRIGPDDLLDVRIPDLLGAAALSLRNTAVGTGSAPAFQQGLRVTADGTVNVPMLGPVRAAGLTARALEEEIGRRLIAAGILRTPHVTVLVTDYRSRVVAVVGRVERPGLYPVTRPGATVADMLWAAGGPTKDAGRIIEFSPAPSGTVATLPDYESAPLLARADDVRLAGATLSDATAPVADGVAAEPHVPPTTANVQPLRIDLAVLLAAAGHDPNNWNPQVRQGDVISVVAAGSVLVDGWVQRPGSYPITPNLTVNGAFAAAGGANFAADLSQVTVRRVVGPGEERVLRIDLHAVTAGQQRDVALVDGDVIYAPASTARVIPWGIWTFVTTIFRVGASIVAV